MQHDFPFLVGRTVEQIWIWGPIRLVFDLDNEGPEPQLYVDVHEGSQLRDGSTRMNLDVLAQPDEAGAILRLLKRRVANATAADGVLRLSFANGAELVSPPDDQYESWTVVGEGRIFQCLPGGEVDSW